MDSNKRRRTMSFEKIALFGASGQIGQRILDALLACKSQTFTVRCFVPQDKLGKYEGYGDPKRVSAVVFDVDKLSKDNLAGDLKNVDVVISALNGKALEAQGTIQDAAADAGVQRFYPSEYGMHNIYRKPGDPQGYVHPMWDLKARLVEQAVLHPAVTEGKMSFTVIGCGDFYNQDREKIWCPWTQKGVSKYNLPVIGDAGEKAQYTNLDDFATFLVATLCEPEKSEDQYLNFVSDTISHNEIAGLLEKYTEKPVEMEEMSFDDMHKVIADPSSAPEHLSKDSAFPVDFWFLVKGTQGQGRFVRPRSQVHNHLFPDVKITTFEDYLRERFAAAKSQPSPGMAAYSPIEPEAPDEVDKKYWVD